MIILTHDGIFHADELLAVSILKRLHPQAEVRRSRNPKEVDLADFVLDVGGKFDTERFFDHHQRDGGPEPRSNGVPYSSFGLVWRRFGADYVRIVAAAHVGAFATEVDVEAVVGEIDISFVQGVDATDNGAVNPAKMTLKADGRVDVRVTTLNAVLAAFNTVALIHADSESDSRFATAQAVASELLQQRVLAEIARQKGETIINAAILAAADGPVVELPEFVLGWQQDIVTRCPNAKFVVHPKIGGGWQAATVPVAVGSFEARQTTPKEWWGMKPAELATATGVPDVIFCHQAGAFFAAKSKEGCLALVEKALSAS